MIVHRFFELVRQTADPGVSRGGITTYGEIIMKKAIIAVSTAIAAASIVIKSGDFGAIPSITERRKYKERCSHHNGKTFIYPAEWAENGLPDDVRVSSKGTVPSDKLPVLRQTSMLSV